ncbi:hypothetical protein JXI42_13375 [bacterium]|nr:hypothetical protein [bacterium]
MLSNYDKAKVSPVGYFQIQRGKLGKRPRLSGPGNETKETISPKNGFLENQNEELHAGAA